MQTVWKKEEKNEKLNQKWIPIWWFALVVYGVNANTFEAVDFNKKRTCDKNHRRLRHSVQLAKLIFVLKSMSECVQCVLGVSWFCFAIGLRCCVRWSKQASTLSGFLRFSVWMRWMNYGMTSKLLTFDRFANTQSPKKDFKWSLAQPSGYYRSSSNAAMITI